MACGDFCYTTLCGLHVSYEKVMLINAFKDDFYFSFVLFIYFSELGISNHLLYIYRYISSS